MEISRVVALLRSCDKPMTIMEVCGSHTSSIMRNGIRGIISPKIKLVAGPGCPVCVTPPAYIDALIDYAFRPSHRVLSFGDLLKIQGSRQSLAEAKAAGARVDVVYSPLQAIQLAKDNPDIIFIVAAVGFETTAPVHAVLADKIIKSNLANIRLLTAIKTMPPILDYVCQREAVDGFICPGHVSSIIGMEPYRVLSRSYRKPFVVAGFEAEHVLAALYEIMTQLEQGRFETKNLYASAVTGKPQPKAATLIDNYFTPDPAYWRGIGTIDKSGLYLRPEYHCIDAGSHDLGGGDLPNGCRCGEVILGRIDPDSCPLFGTVCRPDNAVGACMASPEGACGIWHENAETRT